MATILLWAMVCWGTTMIVSRGKIFADLRDLFPAAHAAWFLVDEYGGPSLVPIDDPPKDLERIPFPPSLASLDGPKRELHQSLRGQRFLLDMTPAALTWNNFFGSLLGCPMCLGFWVGVFWAAVGMAPIIVHVGPWIVGTVLSGLANGVAASAVCWTWFLVLERIKAGT